MQKESSLFLHTFVKLLQSKMKNQSRNLACHCRKICFNIPTSSSFSRMMKLADSSLTDHIQLLNKPLEGRESFFLGGGVLNLPNFITVIFDEASYSKY